jgi:hypothetical protein
MTPQSLTARVLILASLAFAPLYAGCGDSGGSTDAGPPDMAKRVVDLTGPRSGIGESCKPGKAPRGTCMGDNALCLTDGQFGLNGGYCVQDCVSTGCPSDSDCVELAPRLDYCMALCNTDADCRANEGYVCSDYNVCVPKLGFYLGSAVRPGTNDGMACDPAKQTPATNFAANQQLSLINGAQTSLAVDEVNGVVVVAWQQLYGTPDIMVASSQDGGMTFNPPIKLPQDKLVDTGNTHSDPVVGVDSTGTFFVAYTSSGMDPTAVFVARSTDGGLTFPDVFAASPPDESAADTLSKPSIAVGNNDAIYVSWTTSITGSRVVRAVVSGDGGATWSAPADVTPDDTVDHENARLAVSSDHTVFATWVEANGDPHGDTKNKVAIQHLSKDLAPIGGRVLASAATDSVTLDVPSIAVDGANVYVVYTTGSPEGQWDIKAAYSANSGAAFKPPVKVNSDMTCATHFHPAAAIDAVGALHVVYYDNRNLDGGVRHQLGESTTGTLVFKSEEVVNDMPFPFSTESGSFDWLGDYLGLWAGSGTFIGWADTRTNQTSQIFFTESL